jgi:hypothetical protein
MKGRLLIAGLVCLLGCIALVNAQGQDFNVSCLNKYYHNWQNGVRDVYVNEDYAFLACFNEGLRILDISDPDAITQLSRVELQPCLSVNVYGDYAYAGTYHNVVIIDITDMQNPRIVTSVPTSGAVNSITFGGSVAYVSNSTGGMTFIDISDPEAAQVIWETNYISEVFNIVVRQDKAYVAANEYGLLVLDITDPSRPVEVATYDPPNYEYVTGVAIDGDYAYLASGGNGFEVVELATMQKVAGIDSLYYGFMVKLSGNYAYLTYGDPDCPLAIIDISGPEAPQTVSIYYPPEDLVNFALANDRIYLADGLHGLRVLDITSPAEPVEDYVYSRYGHDLDVAVDGDLAYVREDYKLKIIDVADAQNPVEVGYYEAAWQPVDMKLVGNTAFLVRNNNDCLYAIDITDPQEPRCLDKYRVESIYTHYRMIAIGNYAYVVENNGLRIVDISDPSDMQSVGYYSLRAGDTRLEVYGDKLFVQGSDVPNYLIVLDISDPAHPHELLRQYIGSDLWDMKVTGNLLLMMTDRYIRIFDADQLTSFKNLRVVSDDVYLTDIDVNGNYVFVTANDGSLSIYDLTDPVNPSLVGYSSMPSTASGLCVVDNIAYIADCANLGIYDCSLAMTGIVDDGREVPSTYALLANYPNPFNASTNIRFEMPVSGYVSIDIFDLLGRRVTGLVNDEYAAGNHAVIWNGVDSEGMPVASGRYYVRATLNDKTESLPIMLLK